MIAAGRKDGTGRPRAGRIQHRSNPTPRGAPTGARWLLLALLAAAREPLSAQAVAITDATVFPVSGPRIEHGTVLVEHGRITAVGRDITIPEGTTRIDAAGKWVTPGLIHAWTNLGLFEVGSVSETREAVKTGEVNPAFNVAEGINPQSVLIPITRAEGVTAALSVPSGGLIAGQGVFIRLAGDRVEDLVVRSPAAMVMDLSTESKGAGGGSRAGVLQRLRQLFDDAREYERRAQDYRKNQIQPLAAPGSELAALGPVLRGEVPVFLIANRQSDIESALRLAGEYRLRAAIVGGREAWRVGPRLARAGVPVILDPLADIPSFDALGARLDNAALLREAGVEVVLVETDEFNYRNLRFAAGNAVRNGLPWDDALRAVTLAPARVLGVGDRYGSLEPGKTADLVVWSGDPFELSTRAEQVFIGGTAIPPTTRQTELRERYRTLPPRY
ncbi:MAG TPA: amidohydrolase family protein [Gemmatimonadales bacterium]|nr:amidohydrolase family protein [Gemmatimonadales bacterium]